MANTKQARKRILQNETARLRNRLVRGQFRSLAKKIMKNLKGGEVEAARTDLPALESLLDRAAKKNVIHTKTADRLKSRMKKRLHVAGTSA